MTTYRTFDLVSVAKQLDPHAGNAGPGSGFAPYKFGGGRVRKFSGEHRRQAAEAPAKDPAKEGSPYLRDSNRPIGGDSW